MSTQKRITSPESLVERFNKLPRKSKVPSGRVDNDWHFDIRYVPLQPPGHILAMVNPGSLFIHIEHLPLDAVPGDGGIAFFPESGKEAAPEIAKAILHAFVDNMGQNKMMGKNVPAPIGPWKLITEDRELAVAVSEELKRIGVLPAELCKVGVSSHAVTKKMDEAFKGFYNGLTRSMGFTGIAADALATPEPVIFSNFKPDVPRDLHDQNEYDLPLQYVQILANARPPSGPDIDSKSIVSRARDEMVVLLKLLDEKPEAVVRREADDGNALAALDYAMRLYVGLGCKRSCPLSRHYFVKAILSPDASDTTKATAHGVLIDWCIKACESGTIRSRYLLMASHHADQAALFCRRVTPEGWHSSAAVLWFMKNTFERFAPDVPQLWLLYKHAMNALEERDKQVEGGRSKMQQKRMDQPLRYRCAAVGCGVEADAGSMLQRCAGKCDADKKPSYCSKECQKADWKNHKPFCHPGAECSVIDDRPTDNSSFKTGRGSLQIPITYADGSKTMMSSSTLNPQMLREIRDIASSRDLPNAMASMSWDLESAE